MYLYRDKANGYNFYLNVRYVSKEGLFYFVPEKLNIVPRKQEYKRNTSLTVTWYGNTSGTVNFQHDIFEFLPIGFSAGSINNKFLAGVTAGIRF